MTFITHGFGVSVVSDIQGLGSPLRFMLRRSSLVECVSVLHGTCLQCVKFFFIHQYVQPCLSKNPKYTFYTIKSLLTLAYETGTAMNARESENYLAISRSSSASKTVKIFLSEIYRGRLFLGPNLVSFNCTVVPYEISKVNFRVENSCQYVRRDLINIKISI